MVELVSPLSSPPRGGYRACAHPAQPKQLEPEVTVRVSREYRNVSNVLENSILNLKYECTARKLYAAKIFENFFVACTQSARQLKGAWVCLQFPVLSERAYYSAKHAQSLSKVV